MVRKTTIALTMTAFAMLCSTSASLAQFVQSEHDNGAADSVIFEFTSLPSAQSGRLTAEAELSIFADADTINGMGFGWTWQNQYMVLDSVIVSTIGASVFDYFLYTYFRNNIDSSNSSRRILFAGFNGDWTFLNPSTSRQLLATYYFSFTQWTEQDSIVVDSSIYDYGVVPLLSTTEWTEYSPYREARAVAYNDPGECCVAMRGNANCDPDDIVSAADISTIVDFLYISGTPLCCLKEADANASGGANPTNADISNSDISYITDHLYITGAPLPDCE